MDIGIFLILIWFTGDTLGGMIVATISSALVSIYLLLTVKPSTDENEESDENTL